MITIYDWFGYEVSIKDRYKLIKEAGFDGVLLWWSDGFGRGADYREGVQHVINAGLMIENMHTPVQNQNNLSLDNIDGENVFECYSECIKDCAEVKIPTMVVHLPNDNFPITELGMERIKRITEKAERLGINIAMENLSNVNNIACVLNSINSKQIGFCYDSCHHANNENAGDLLAKYEKRLMALHLHDNGGARGQHQLPLDGNIDWPTVMRKIAETGYKGATALEPMNWGYEDLSIQEFLCKAYEKAKTLEKLRFE
ncbi:sugar phosphate isomerase/epimerase family protein [Anaerosporobacter sp.]